MWSCPLPGNVVCSDIVPAEVLGAVGAILETPVIGGARVVSCHDVLEAAVALDADLAEGGAAGGVEVRLT